MAIAAAAIFGYAGSALADPNPNSETTGQPGTGNQNCELTVPGPAGNPYKNPGLMFQDLRAGRGDNPKQVVDAFPASFDNVGDLISQKCGIVP